MIIVYQVNCLTCDVKLNWITEAIIVPAWNLAGSHEKDSIWKKKKKFLNVLLIYSLMYFQWACCCIKLKPDPISKTRVQIVIYNYSKVRNMILTVMYQCSSLQYLDL